MKVQKPAWSLAGTLGRCLGPAVCLAAVVASLLILRSGQARRASLVREIHEVSRGKMASVRDRAVRYLQDVEKDLRLISRNPDVIAWRPDAKRFIDSVYRTNYQYNRLAEVYLVERSFDGTHRPFMTFEYRESPSDDDETDTAADEERHDPLTSEVDEYSALLRQMERFQSDSSLKVEISRPLMLCAGRKGLVMSVPVRRDEELVGMVAGMIPLEPIRGILEEPRCHDMVALTRADGAMVVCEDMPPALAGELARRQLRWRRSGQIDAEVQAAGGPAYWVTTDTVSLDGRGAWQLVFLHDDAAHMAQFRGGQRLAEWACAGLVLALGAAVAFLTRIVAALRAARHEADRRADELLQTNQKLERIAEGIPDSIMLVGSDYEVLWANRAACEQAGRMPQDVLGQTCYSLIHRRSRPCASWECTCPLSSGEQSQQSETPIVRCLRPDGDERHLEVKAHPVLGPDGRVIQHVHISHDVTERVRLEQQLRHQALHDELTGLPNRAYLGQNLRRAVLRSRQLPGFHFAVLFLDFDRFKNINDSLGHDLGDQLLKAIAERLRAAVRQGGSGKPRPDDVTARLGGDEFVILLNGIRGADDAVRVADRLLEVFAEPYRIGEHDVYSTASIGIVTDETAAETAEDVLRDADTAMYEAKLAGKSRYSVFDVSMHQRVRDRLSLENDLRRALAGDELRLMYQPIVSLVTGEVESFEALVRWQHPRRGLISPAEFVPIAEDTGLIIPIGEWSLREACRQFARWRKLMGDAAPRSISVNVSRNQIFVPGLPATIQRILQETGVPASSLHLEITESTIMRDVETATRILHALRKVGAKLDMDDFGTGYSSLACLHQFPMDVLKIDRSFVANVDLGRDFAALVHAVSQLARNLGISVIAEGIETPDQLLTLQSLECDFGQGYLFARPMTHDEVLKFRVPRGVLPGLAA